MLPRWITCMFVTPRSVRTDGAEAGVEHESRGRQCSSREERQGAVRLLRQVSTALSCWVLCYKRTLWLIMCGVEFHLSQSTLRVDISFGVPWKFLHHSRQEIAIAYSRMGKLCRWQMSSIHTDGRHQRRFSLLHSESFNVNAPLHVLQSVEFSRSLSKVDQNDRR